MWTVESPAEVVKDRVGRRSGLTPSEIQSRVATQMPSDERVARSDFVIQNDATIADLKDRVNDAWQKISVVHGEITLDHPKNTMKKNPAGTGVDGQ